MPESTQTPTLKVEAKPWTCPFCPLLCDDIATPFEATATPCPRRTQALNAQTAQPRSPEINGQKTTQSEALIRASQILKTAKHPLFSGLTTDVSGTRSLYDLAAASNAILDHLNGDVLAASTFALQDRGALFTTLSEIRSRADLIIVFACNPTDKYPRFYERTISPSRDVKLISVGRKAETESILEDTDPLDILSIWSALTEANQAPAQANEATNALKTLNDRIKAAKYTALIYEPAALKSTQPALAIEAIHRIVKALNRTVRAGALALTGDDGAITVNQTITWRSGFPLRTRIAYGMPLDHDAHRFRTETLLKENRIDALLWVSSFLPEPLPASLDDETPLIILGHANTTLHARKGPTVFIPVATPGMDHDAHLFRMDISVVAPLSAARTTSLPTVAAIADELSQRRRTP